MEKKAFSIKPLIVYVALAYFISWIIWFPLYSPALGINLPVLRFHHGIGGLGPMIASFITTWIFDKGQGVKNLLKQMIRVGPVWYIIIALLGPFILAGIAAVINALLNHGEIRLSSIFDAAEFPQFSFVSFFLYNLVFFGFGEETGWRGFLLPRLQTRYNAFYASVILTFIWALWHWPLFLYRPGFTGMGVAGTFGWLFSLLTGSILLTWIYNSTRGSILACAVFHSTVDIAFLADFADQNITNYMGILITIWGIATIILFKPANLSYVARTNK